MQNAPFLSTVHIIPFLKIENKLDNYDMIEIMKVLSIGG